MTRVAYFTHYSDLYGANRSLLDLIRGLEPYGVQPVVVTCSPGPLVDALERGGVPVFVEPMKWWMGHGRSRRAAATRAWQNLKLAPRLVRLLRKQKVRLVHTNSSTIPMGALVSALGRWPHVWHLREFGDLDYDLHADWPAGVRRRVMLRARALIAVSDAVRRHHLGVTGGRKVHVIYNGVATESQFDHLRRASETVKRTGGGFCFMLMGLLHRAKGQETAIEAMAAVVRQVPDAKLVLVGRGACSPYAKLAQKLGIERNVEVRGHVDDPLSAFLEADAALMCSKHEAMGRVTVEAMAACLPVIGYDQAGTSELIDHEETGLLYRGGAQELADCMVRLAKDRDLVRRLGFRAWEVARKRFSIETYAARLHEVYSQVLAA